VYLEVSGVLVLLYVIKAKQMQKSFSLAARGRVVILWRLVLYYIFVKFSAVPVMMSLIS